MTALADRLALPDDLRYGWLQANDTYLLCELNKLFKSLYIRGSKIDRFKPGESKISPELSNVSTIPNFLSPLRS
jgi:hypothetical protein